MAHYIIVVYTILLSGGWHNSRTKLCPAVFKRFGRRARRFRYRPYGVTVGGQGAPTVGLGCVSARVPL